MTDLSKLFFTADLHFGHRSMVRSLGREEFPDVETMDECLIQGWNETVSENSTVYLLGDVFFTKRTLAIAQLVRLNGTIHLIRGNHDKKMSSQVRNMFASVQDYKELTVAPWGTKQKIILFHYAIRSWNYCHYGSWNLHGHSHGSLKYCGKQLDVGVDSAKALLGQYRPFSFNEVSEIMADRVFVSEDHHVPRDT